MDDTGTAARQPENEDGSRPVPAAIGGSRMLWSELPLQLRTEIERRLRARVTKAESRDGGFSPGLASRLYLHNGRRVFAKAVNAERSADAVQLHREEIRITAALPDNAPAPRLLDSYDDGEWVVLLMEDVDGHQPAQPWRSDELDRVLTTLTDLAAYMTPAPTVARRASDWELSRWPWIAAHDDYLERLPEISPWAAENLERLLALGAGWFEAAAGETLLHMDLRADNILLAADRVVVVDWPHAMIGAPYVDLLGMLPSVAMHGTDPQPIVERHPLTQDVDPATIDTVLAALAGFFIDRSMRPPVPLLPTIRDFQRAQGLATLEWLANRIS